MKLGPVTNRHATTPKRESGKKSKYVTASTLELGGLGEGGGALGGLGQAL